MALDAAKSSERGALHAHTPPRRTLGLRSFCSDSFRQECHLRCCGARSSRCSYPILFRVHQQALNESCQISPATAEMLSLPELYSVEKEHDANGHKTHHSNRLRLRSALRNEAIFSPKTWSLFLEIFHDQLPTRNPFRVPCMDKFPMLPCARKTMDGEV